MNLLRRAAERLGLIPRRPLAESVLIRIDEELLGTRFGWGPEIEDLVTRLTEDARDDSALSFDGVDRASDGYRLTFHTDDAHRFLEMALPALRASPMWAAISIGLSDERALGHWREVELGKSA